MSRPLGDKTAFPAASCYTDGLSKREYYAGLAMQGFIALGRNIDAEVVARQSVKFADALLSELELRSYREVLHPIKAEVVEGQDHVCDADCDLTRALADSGGDQ